MAKSSNKSSVSAAVVSELHGEVVAVAEAALEAQAQITGASESFRERFRALCVRASIPVVKVNGVERFDKDSEKGKALHQLLSIEATKIAAKLTRFALEVYKVGDEDKYLPVRIWSGLESKWKPLNTAGEVAATNDKGEVIEEIRKPNHVFTAAFALSADLKSLASHVEKPYGAKAWLRGDGQKKRPDNRIGQRDWIKNDVHQALSRGWSMDATTGRTNGGAGEFDDLLANLHKAGAKKRDRFARDNDEPVVSADQWSGLCALIQTLAFNPDLFEAVYQAADDLAKELS